MISNDLHRRTTDISARYVVTNVMILVALLLSMVVSIMVGAMDIDIAAVYRALTTNSDAFHELIIRTVRLPRVLAGVVVGAALAMAGALMQGLTRNPLASPGILGINAGAALAVVSVLVVWGQPPLMLFALIAALGAAIAAVIIAIIARSNGVMTPMRLALSGAIFTAFISAITTAILISDDEALDQIRFWTAGSLAGRDMNMFMHIAPCIAVGMVISLFLGRHVSALSLGEDVATGLGQQTKRVQLWVFVAVVITSGGATALAGPVGFIGLIVPHISRLLVGAHYQYIVPTSGLLGALVVTLADIVSRLVLQPQELPVGVVMGVIGAPFFIFLARKKI